MTRRWPRKPPIGTVNMRRPVYGPEDRQAFMSLAAECRRLAADPSRRGEALRRAAGRATRMTLPPEQYSIDSPLYRLTRAAAAFADASDLERARTADALLALADAAEATVPPLLAPPCPGERSAPPYRADIDG